ncbi:MAG: hypothetical protein LPK45_01670 [Bacteroidota bacterium]|nr:hypothetical protein [Bacteroidota bacterium]MDX5429743.1 hypothetical protein [Bacteroidota bacterium]MDX5468522.1 hypothetical protein [Bacteroidota bacterium]
MASYSISQNIFTIRQGATLENKGMISGALGIVLGILLLRSDQWLLMVAGGLFLVLGIFIFPWIQRIQIDKNEQTLSTHLMIAGFPIRIRQQSIEGSERILIRLFSQNQGLNHRSQSTMARTRSYDVAIQYYSDEFIVFESPDYQKSLEVYEALGDFLNLEKTNLFEEMKSALQARRDR